MNSRNDQWFEPGDKVVRVTTGDHMGLPNSGVLKPETDFGRVLCVFSCRESLFGNLVAFVGIERWCYAACFRKVEEIKLCVEAAQKVKKPEKEVQKV